LPAKIAELKAKLRIEHPVARGAFDQISQPMDEQPRKETQVATSTPTTEAEPARNGDWHRRGLRRFVLPVKAPQPINPALVTHAEARAEDVQNRIADRITTFAGSMTFVYLHILWFGSWIIFRVEDYPFGLLTMIVSLEAIFLSTFVMISQNRADARRQVLADQHWKTVQEEDTQNEELLDLSKEILALTKEIRTRNGDGDGGMARR
jgi:uncharacterized membrane protein